MKLTREEDKDVYIKLLKMKIKDLEGLVECQRRIINVQEKLDEELRSK